MDPITVAAKNFEREVARFEASKVGRALRVVATQTDRGDMVKTLRLLEWAPENRRPMFLHEAPFEGEGPWFTALGDKVREDYEALRAGAAEEGVTLAAFDPGQRVEALPPAGRAVAYVDHAATLLRGRLDGVVVGMCPKQIGDPARWRAAVEAWLGARFPDDVRSYVHDTPAGTLEALFHREAVARFEVDQDALMEYLKNLGGAPASAGPAVAPPPAPTPEQRAAFEQATGRRLPTPEAAKRLRTLLLEGAQKTGRQDWPGAAQDFRLAGELCRGEGLVAEEASVLVALASLCLGMGLRERAREAYEQAAAVGLRAGLHAVVCQARMGVAGVLLIDRQHQAAAVAYEGAAEAAKEGAIPLLRIEGLRLAGTCHASRGDERAAMRCWQAAVDEGAAADDATRGASTLGRAGEALAEVLTRHGLHAQAAHVRLVVAAKGV